MSDTNQGVASSETDESTCPSLPKSTRILAYYIQAIVGILLIIINLTGGTVFIFGLVLLFTTPLWEMKPIVLFKQLINPIRLTSFIILITTIVLFYIFNQSLPFGIAVTCASFWYFLSFIPGGQEWCKNCLQGCCNNCNKQNLNENLV